MTKILDLRNKFKVSSLIFARRYNALDRHSDCGLESHFKNARMALVVWGIVQKTFFMALY